MSPRERGGPVDVEGDCRQQRHGPDRWATRDIDVLTVLSARIVRGNAVLHDLLSEELLRSLPCALFDLLHRRAPEVLEAQGAPPGIVASHLLESGDREAASSFVAQAARAARDAMLEPGVPAA